MPDITMCKGEGCEAKHTCYRYTAKPNEYQYYFIETPDVNGGCEYYINHNHIYENIKKGAELFVKNAGDILKKLSEEKARENNKY